ncbi:epoxide hydrolase 1-like [Tasmannia lanceolata]|uniref:epoxide hydrolase 1-like n=1 Tax=Tasmannia lanceolata TaxID=3420 RepID=UPI004063E3B7
MGSELRHRMVLTNGIRMHIAEQGTGPLVLLLHGFPGLWFSWRNQIVQLAKRGYHVVAPDMRGYGDTDSPPDPSSYTYFHIVGDLIGLLDDLHEEKAFVVGHDWGAEIAWHLSLFRPDRVKALVSLGIPFQPRSAVVKMMASMFGGGFYISQFQDIEKAEKAFARYDYYTILKQFHVFDKHDIVAPPTMEISDFLENPSSLPTWLTEEELQYFASKFQKSGFTGPLNYYRAISLNLELLAPWQGAKITVPTKIIVGDKDLGFKSFGTEDYLMGEAFQSLVTNLEVAIIDGHHFIQQEKAKEVTDELLSFFVSDMTYYRCPSNKKKF